MTALILGVIIAMTKEHDQLVGMLDNVTTETIAPFTYTKGTFGGHTIIMQQCGIGKVNAAVGASELIKAFHPDALISTGVAGGIDAKVDIMDVVVGAEVVYHDVTIPGCALGQVQGLPERFCGNETLLQAALSLHDEHIHTGLICSGDQFISDRSQLDVIKGNFPEGLAVDMESGALAQTCYLYKVPFISFRIISDTPGADEHLKQYFNFWSDMADHSFEVTRRFLSALPKEIPATK